MENGISLGYHRVAQWLVLFGILASLACGTGLAAASPTPPGGAIPASAVAADDLERAVRNQLFDPSKTTYRFSINNQQATSYLALRAGGIPIDKAQVWFTQGRVFLRGTLTAICLYHPDILIIAAPTVKDNLIVANIQQIYAGSFVLPADWNAVISKSITDSIAEARLNLNFDRIDVLEGEIVVSGSKRTN